MAANVKAVKRAPDTRNTEKYSISIGSYSGKTNWQEAAGKGHPGLKNEGSKGFLGMPSSFSSFDCLKCRVVGYFF